MIILENVKNLKSHDKGKTYQVIEEKLQDCIILKLQSWIQVR